MVVLLVYYDSTITKRMVTSGVNLLEHIIAVVPSYYKHLKYRTYCYEFVYDSYVMIVPGSTPSSL